MMNIYLSNVLADIYQSLAVAEQYVLYHDLEHSFWKIFAKFHYQQSRIAPTTLGLITLPPKKEESPMTHFL